MKFQIGFAAAGESLSDPAEPSVEPADSAAPVKSLVQVRFPAANRTLAYFNDRFDLHKGDFVYVDGQLAGECGQVVDVSCDFKIKISDYKRVIGRAQTEVAGTFFMAGSHLITYNPAALPFEQAVTWFRAPQPPVEDYVVGDGEDGFPLDDLGQIGIHASVAQRGEEYYLENKVAYLAVDGTVGRAIVTGQHPYEVEFQLQNGEIRHLFCTCPCAYTCKHELAAMLQLRETLAYIAAQGEIPAYFAAVSKSVFFTYAVSSRESGSLTLA